MKRFEGSAQQQRARRLEFEGAQQSEPADFRHHLVFGEALPQHPAQLVALRRGARAELLVLQYVQRRQPRAHREPVLAIGGGMNEGALQRAVNRIAHLVRHEHRAARNQSAADRFGENDHIRLDAIVMGGEKGPGSMEASLHLVQREQGSVAPAELLGLLEVARRRQAHAALSLNRLQHEGREALRREVVFERFDVAERRRLRVRKQGTKPVPPECIRHQRERAAGQAMKAVRGIENARALGVGAREFDDGFDSLAAGAGEKHFGDASAGAGAELFPRVVRRGPKRDFAASPDRRDPALAFSAATSRG